MDRMTRKATDNDGRLDYFPEGQLKYIMSGEWDSLELVGISYISPEAAKTLASSKLKSVSFPNLEDLPIDVADELSKFEGYEMEFPSLLSISDELASSFSHFRVRSLVFDNVTSLSDQAALYLSRFGNPMVFGDEMLTFLHCPDMSAKARQHLEESPAYSDGDAIRQSSGMTNDIE